MKHTNKKSGFTLVELAIVLVIIGLIIGGVLTGADLIKAATIRSAVTDIEKFNAGATTFRGKYNGLPGDLLNSKAVEFAFSAAATDANANGGVGLRDGNGIIEGGATASTKMSGETALFWRDLGTAGLIAGTYTGYAGAALLPAAAVGPANVKTFVPSSKLRDSASYYVFSTAGRNVFYLGAITTALATGVVTPANAVSVLEAKQIDEKLDDGAPLTGTVVDVITDMITLDTFTGSGTTTSCIAGAAGVQTYNSAPANSSGVNCQLQIRSSF